MRPDLPHRVVAEGLCAALLLGALAFGGDPATTHYTVQALGAAALAWGLIERGSPGESAVARGLHWILLAAAVVAGLQLLPLPPGLWRSLPQRAGVWNDLQTAGVALGWRPMTLDVTGTLRSLLALQLFAGMWLLSLRLDPKARERVLMLALVAGVALALWGFAQVRAKSDTTGATATFANRNHFASLTAMLVPFAMAFAGLARDLARKVAGYAAALVLLLAAALTFSRAGSVLALGAAIASGWVLRSAGARRPGQILATAVSAASALAIVGYYAWDRLSARFTSDLLSDARWTFAANGVHAVAAYLPWGSGLGSFRWVYQGFEPAAGLGEYTFAAHAHNELVEIAIEAGIPGLMLAAVFIAWVVFAVAHARSPQERSWRPAAAVACVVVLLHSLVDFPLRTDACSVVLALACAVVCSPPPQNPASRTPSSR